MPRKGDATSQNPLLSVEEALDRVLQGLAPCDTETLPLSDAMGRTLASSLHARFSLPSEAVSAMDGYAVRSADCDVADFDVAGCELTRIGESAAGHPWNGTIGAGETVRIFTGAVLPDGADAILLQEDASASQEADGARIIVNEPPAKGQFIRPAGLDVTEGDCILEAGTVLSARAIALGISAGHLDVDLVCQPRIGILSTGDELQRPGSTPGRGQIISSNAIYLANFIHAAGAIPVDLGIAADRPGAMLDAVRATPSPLDLVVTTGGASVGVHDHIVDDLADSGSSLNFWKIAMRPGKPLISGQIDQVPLLGLPGNPVSSAICAHIFLRPAIARLSGGAYHPQLIAATLASDLRENDRRQDYLRAQLMYDPKGYPQVMPAKFQDSSMISVYANANALIVRPPFDPPQKAGDTVTVMPIDPSL